VHSLLRAWGKAAKGKEGGAVEDSQGRKYVENSGGDSLLLVSPGGKRENLVCNRKKFGGRLKKAVFLTDVETGGNFELSEI